MNPRLWGIPPEGDGHAICERTLPRTTDCGACRLLRMKLEGLRDHLYRTLEAAGMDHSHPEVLEVSVAFDELLNVYLRHQDAHRSHSVPLGQPASHSPRGRVEAARG